MTALSGTPTTRLGLKTFASGDVPDLYSSTGGLTEVLTQIDTAVYERGNAYGGSVASAATIAVTAPGLYLLTGTTTVSAITGGTSGMTITLQASGQSSGVPVILTYGTASNAIKLRGARSLGIYAFVPADNGAAGAGESVTLCYDGTAWVEISRDLRTVLSFNNAVDGATISATSAAAGNELATATSFTFDGATPVVVSLYLYVWVTGNTAGSALFANFWDGATPLQRCGYLNNIDTGQQQSTLFIQVRLTPSAAARAYGFRAMRATSNGEWQSSSSTATNGSAQGFIRIERDI